MALGFGRRNQTREDVEANQERIRREAEAHASSGGDRIKIREGDNLFWIMPPLVEKTIEPFRSMRVHYNPFEVCSGMAPIFNYDTDDKKKKVRHVAKITDCERCKLDWNDYGYDFRTEDKKAWLESKIRAEFEKSKAMDKVLFVAFPMNEFYTVEKKKVGLRSTTQELVANPIAAKKFRVLMQKYIEHTATDEFQESIKDGLDNPSLLRYRPKDAEVDVEWGVAPIMFSFFSWHEDIYPAISEAIASGEIPWGADDEGGIPALLNIRRTGSGRQDTAYSGAILTIPEGERLKISSEFYSEVLLKYVPDVSQIYLPKDAATMRKNREEFLSARAETARKSAEEFSDDENELPPIAKGEKGEKAKPAGNKSRLSAPPPKKNESVDDDDDLDDDGALTGTDDDIEVDEDEWG